MNIRDALDQVDALKPNQFDEQQKIYWLSQVDQRIYNDVVLRHERDESMPESFGGYPPDVDQDTQLLASAPFDALYRWWLEAMIDLGNGELGKYQNSMLLFNSAWNDFAKDYRRKHMPLGQQKIGFTAGGRKPCGATGDAMDQLTQATQDANKAAFSAQLIAQTLREKLDSGELKGEDGSDASVTAENVQAALGYTPVKDVQLNGESLVQDSVATLPLAGYNRLGVVQLDPAGFAAASVDGKLELVPPTDAQISTHTNTQRPITPSCMDYAVKAAMCDGKGAAWTEAEQKAARERMGADKLYELIEDIENSEQMKGIFESVTAKAGIKANSSVRAAKYEAEIPVDIASMSSTGNVIYEDEKWHFDLGGKITGNVEVVGGKLYLVYPDITFESGIDGDINTNPCTITLGDDHVAIFSANDANWYVVLTPSTSGKVEISFEANDNWRGYISGFHIKPIKSNAGIPFISNDISMMSHINNLSLGGHRNILYGSKYGRQNTSFGYNAQKNINTGVWNSAVGFNAQSKLTSGKGNNAFGFSTQSALTTGCYNNAFGESAQNHMVDGQWNDGFGIETQGMCTNGKNNVAFGRRSQYLLETGCFNTAVGAWSGFNYHGQKEGKYAVKTANYTTLIGASAVLASEEQSDYATALGFQAMVGAKCIALGADAKAKGDESVAIGYGVEATKDKEIVIGTSNHSIIICGKKIIFNADHTVTWEDV